METNIQKNCAIRLLCSLVIMIGVDIAIKGHGVTGFSYHPADNYLPCMPEKLHHSDMPVRSSDCRRHTCRLFLYKPMLSKPLIKYNTPCSYSV